MIADDLNVQRTQYTQNGTISGSQFVWLKGCYTQRVVNGATILNYPAAGGYVPSASFAQFYLKGHGNSSQNVCYIAFAFKVAAIATATATSIRVAKTAYSFVPTIGMKLGKCPSSLSTNIIYSTVTAVADNDTYYTLTMSSAIGALAVTDFLVEAVAITAEEADITVDKVAASAPSTATTGDTYLNTADGKVYTATNTDTWGTGVLVAAGEFVYDSDGEKFYALLGEAIAEVSAGSLLIQNPNTFIGEEMYFEAAGIKGVTLGSDPYSTPLYVHNTAYTSRMPLYPQIFIDALNKSKIAGLIEI